MKAALGKDYGDIEKMLYVDESVKYPCLKDRNIPLKERKDFIIIKTHAVALACGDVRVLSGLTRELQGPPSFPYIPCGDCCGTVVEIPSEGQDDEQPSSLSSSPSPSSSSSPSTSSHASSNLKVGDRVAVRFSHGPRDALAEYALVKTKVCTKVPDHISSIDAAALAGACPATLLAERIITAITDQQSMQESQQKIRVLVLGAGGGLGSHVPQIIRSKHKDSFIVGVSCTPRRLLEPPLCYDKAFDYTVDDIFSMTEFLHDPFDVVLDLAGGGWMKLIHQQTTTNAIIVKPASQGGRYLTTTPDNPIFEIHSIPSALHLFLIIPLWRAIKSRLWARFNLPSYTYAMSLPMESTHLTRTFDMAAQGTLKAVIDEKGPFPFTTKGVREAFQLQESRHPHGKVVIQITQDF